MDTEEDLREVGRTASFGERHAATFIGIVLFALLAFVMAIQVAC